MSHDFIPFHRPSVYPKHLEAVAKVLESGWLTTAGVCEKFEQEFLKHVGGKYAVAVSSCTAAIQLALAFLGKNSQFDNVITSPITFVSAVNVIEQLGFKTVFAEVRDSDLTIDPESASNLADARTRAIIATNLAGIPPQAEELQRLSVKLGIPIIYDAAHGIEAKYNQARSGELGWANCYSFYATKNITCGEGGMLVTDDQALADYARRMRLHGMDKDAWKRYGPAGYKHWDVSVPGWKMNLSDINAALGLAQLEDMENWCRTRRTLYAYYQREFGRDPRIKLLEIPEEASSAYHLFIIRIKNRDLAMNFIQEAGVGVGVHFRGVHTLQYWKAGLGSDLHLRNASRASEEVLSLPLYPGLSIQQATRVVSVVKDVLDDVDPI